MKNGHIPRSSTSGLWLRVSSEADYIENKTYNLVNFFSVSFKPAERSIICVEVLISIHEQIISSGLAWWEEGLSHFTSFNHVAHYGASFKAHTWWLLASLGAHLLKCTSRNLRETVSSHSCILSFSLDRMKVHLRDDSFSRVPLPSLT